MRNKTQITEYELLERISDKISEFDSQAEFCKEVGINRTGLNHILAGRRKPNPTLIEFMGYEKQTVYTER